MPRPRLATLGPFYEPPKVILQLITGIRRDGVSRGNIKSSSEAHHPFLLANLPRDIARRGSFPARETQAHFIMGLNRSRPSPGRYLRPENLSDVLGPRILRPSRGRYNLQLLY